MVIHLGGRFVTPEEARVSLLDRGYLLGDGVFATMRGYDGACFRPTAHLAELARGSALLGIEPSPDLERVGALADEAARRTSAAHAYVRVTLTSGATGEPPTLSILARPMTDVPSDEDYARGIDTVTVRARRFPPACIDGTIKTTSYVAALIASREAASKGAATGIQLAIDGALACGAMANLFVVIGDALFTPSLESGCRAGVTRAAVLEIAPRLGLTVHEQRLDPKILDDSDEAFITSTRVECLPIATLDGRRVGRGSGFERTRALRDALLARIREETCSRSVRTGTSGAR